MITTEKRIIASLLFLLFIALSGCGRDSDEPLFYMQNSKLCLGFAKSNGSLREVRDVQSGHNFLDQKSGFSSPWQIVALQNGVNDTIDFSAAQHFIFHKPDNETLEMEWKGFSKSITDLAVKVTVRLEANRPLSNWRISLRGLAGRQISQVTFPRIAGIADLGDERLAVPQWMGQLLANPRQHLAEITKGERKYEWSYPGLLSMQCLALYNPNKCGLYAACDDSLAYLKNFVISLDSLRNLNFAVIHYSSLDSRKDIYEPGYGAVLGTFKGDWLTAAEQYREWGTQQRWCRDARFKTGATPDWLAKTALWIWNRGKSAHVLQPAADLQKRLGLPVSVFWHWWHGCSYDDGFPEYIPPREGIASFRSALSNAHDQDIHAIVYMNQVLWGTSTSSWQKENAAAYSAKNIRGETISHVFNIFTNHALAYMCMATPFWRNKYATLCDTVVNSYSSDGVYMDMACLSQRCYDPAHGHPIGGGHYWVDNFGKLVGQIRSTVRAENQPVLAGEGSAEAWLPYLDLFLTLAVSKERYAGPGFWETIPFFQAVYHQYSITYGNYSSLVVPPYDELWPKKYAPKEPRQLLDKHFDKQFMMEQARSFVWGLQPCLANYYPFLAEQRQTEIAFLLELAKVRNRGLKYLLHGRFVRTPDMIIPEQEIDISRLSIYAGKKGESVLAFRKSYPMVYCGTWQAPDGNVGIAMANIGDTAYKVNCSFKASNYSLPQSGKIYLITPNGKTVLNEFANNSIHLDFNLPGRGLCIVEMTGN